VGGGEGVRPMWSGGWVLRESGCKAALAGWGVLARLRAPITTQPLPRSGSPLPRSGPPLPRSQAAPCAPAAQEVVHTHQRQERRLEALAAVVKQALVEQRKQRVEDGGVGLEDLIDEGHLCGRRKRAQAWAQGRRAGGGHRHDADEWGE